MSVKEELEKIAEKSGGILSPVAVVEFAKNPKTELHGKFCWDDSEAAKQYRLWQARQVISCVVTKKDVSETKEIAVRTYFSLPEDRKGGMFGYRNIDSIMTDEELMKKLESLCESELKAVRQKYNTVKKYAAIFDLIDRIP